MMDKEEKYEDKSPGFFSWLTALSSSFLIFLALYTLNDFSFSVHDVVIKNRLNKILDNTNNPKLVLNLSLIHI